MKIIKVLLINIKKNSLKLSILPALEFGAIDVILT